jgi:hypothetical protein
VPGLVTILAAVEGNVDETVAIRLIRHVGAVPGPVYGRKGKPYLRQKIEAYNRAAGRAPWLVLVDLDHEAECVPPMRQMWIPEPAPNLCFRVAVRAVESWLMADAQGLASFIGVPLSRVPRDPDEVDKPNATLVHLAARSRRRAIRDDMVPRDGSGRPVGPAYTSRLMEFAESHWCPDQASNASESLRRAIACLRRLVTNDGA